MLEFSEASTAQLEDVLTPGGDPRSDGAAELRTLLRTHAEATGALRDAIHEALMAAGIDLSQGNWTVLMAPGTGVIVADFVTVDSDPATVLPVEQEFSAFQDATIGLAAATEQLEPGDCWFEALLDDGT